MTKAKMSEINAVCSLEIPLAAKRVARGGKAVEEAADDGGRYDPGRHRQARQAQRTCRQVGEAQLAHDARMPRDP